MEEPKFSIEQELKCIKDNYVSYLELSKNPKVNSLEITKRSIESFLSTSYDKITELKRERTSPQDIAELQRELPGLYKLLLRLKSVLPKLPKPTEPQPYGGKGWERRAKERQLQKQKSVDPTQGQAIADSTSIGGK